MLRCVYAVPNVSVFHGDILMKLEQDVEESRISSTEFRTQLHVILSTEIPVLVVRYSVHCSHQFQLFIVRRWHRD